MQRLLKRILPFSVQSVIIGICRKQKGVCPCQDRHGAVGFVVHRESIPSAPTGARMSSRSCCRWTSTRSFGWLTWSSKPTGSVPRKWIFPALPCRRFTKAHGARSQRVLSTGNRCTSPGETTASAEDRRQPTAAAAAGCREPTQKNPTKIAKEIPL